MGATFTNFTNVDKPEPRMAPAQDWAGRGCIRVGKGAPGPFSLGALFCVESWSGEGVELQNTGGHIVAFNGISLEKCRKKRKSAEKCRVHTSSLPP